MQCLLLLVRGSGVGKLALLSLAAAIFLRAPASDAMASRLSLGTDEDHWNGEEKRIAGDGRPYTRREFSEYYGESWNARWEEASIATAGGAPQPAAAADPGGPCTSAQLSPQAQPAPTIAGAPQPGAAAGPGV